MTSKKNKLDCGISGELLKILVCPLTKTRLVLDKDNCELLSLKAKLAYPIRDGIPILIAEEARKLKKSEL